MTQYPEKTIAAHGSAAAETLKGVTLTLILLRTLTLIWTFVALEVNVPFFWFLFETLKTQLPSVPVASGAC